MHISTWQHNRDNSVKSSDESTGLKSLRLFGLDVTHAGTQTTLDWICQRLDAHLPTRIAFLNAHCVNVAAKDAVYREALSDATAVLPDGAGIALASWLKGERLEANLNGTDIVPALCQRLAASGHSVFMLGGRHGVAERAAKELVRACPGLRIVGTQDGYFEPDAEAGLVRRINASGAAVLLVAMGVPLQDAWLARLAPQLSPTVLLGVGALFDFLSGGVSRAPESLRSMGLEWCWRLLQEPSRLWRRYLLGNPAFILRATREALRTTASTRPRLDAFFKRTVDLVGAAAGLLIAGPILLVAAAIVRATSPGPAFLRQTRIGEDGVPFTMFKVRSMYRDADDRRAELLKMNTHGASGLTFKLQRDPRITPIGRLIRKTSIDELPQLWNILKGDMSLVGPRPQLPGEVARYKPAHFRRLAGKPGITCLWQISGRADIAFEQQFELDMEYLRTRNVFVDIGILLRTIPAVLSARGAY